MVERWFDFGRVGKVAFSRNAEGVRCLALSMAAAPEGVVRERALMSGWMVDPNDGRVLRHFGTFKAQSEVVEALSSVFPKRDVLAALKPVSSSMTPDVVNITAAASVDPDAIAELVKAGGAEFQDRVRGLVARFQLLHGARMLKNSELPFGGDGLGILNRLIDKVGLERGAVAFSAAVQQVSRGHGQAEIAAIMEYLESDKRGLELPTMRAVQEQVGKILEVYAKDPEEEQRRVVSGFVMVDLGGDMPYAMYDSRRVIEPLEASGAISVRGRGAVSGEIIEDVRRRAEWSVRAIASVFNVEPKALFSGNLVSIVVGPAVGMSGALGVARSASDGARFRHGIIEITPASRGTLVHELAHQVEFLGAIDATVLPRRYESLKEDFDRVEWERLEALEAGGVINSRMYRYLADDSESFARMVEAAVGSRFVTAEDRYGLGAGGALGTSGGVIGSPGEALCLEMTKTLGPYLGSLVREMENVPAMGR